MDAGYKEAEKRIQEAKDSGARELDLQSLNLRDLSFFSSSGLERVQRLVLRLNRFSVLPESVTQLTGLELLDLSNCHLEKIPDSITELVNLQWLYLGGNQLAELPDNITELVNLQGLYLNRCQLRELPDCIGQIVNLRELYLNGNQLRELPSSVGRLSSLEKLYLNDNHLKTFPVFLKELKSLQELILSGNKLGSLPDYACCFPELKRLSLSQNQLKELPDDIAQLSKLERLDLRNCQLEKMPDNITELVNLKFLDLMGGRFSVLPESVTQLTGLELLDLRNCHLEKIPDSITELVNLRWLYLGKNFLTELPQNLTNLTNLQTLDLSSLQLEDFPESLSRLTNLKVLDLRENQLSRLPESVGSLVNLQTLGLQKNQLKKLPKSIGNLVNLKALHLGENQLTELPKGLSKLISLERLYLRENQLTFLLESAWQLPALKELYLDENQLTELPESLSQLTSLERLDLGGNQMTGLPKSISKLTRLERLYLGGNQITGLPESFARLANLQRLDLSENKLVELPESFARLMNLQTLILRGNQLTELPESLSQLTNLRRLDLRGNLFDVADEIFGQQPSDLIAYLLQLEKGKRPLHEAKLIFVGNGDVGKSSLIKRLVHNTFDQAESPTLGVHIEDWNLTRDEDNILLHLWDFGGQEIMHSTHRFFMTRRSVYVLVVEARTEDQQGHTPLNYWLALIRSFAGNSPIVVVANKCDGGIQMNFTRRALHEKYPQIIDFVETSCKENVGIADLKCAVKKALTSSFMQHLDDKIPASYFLVKERLQEKNRNFIEYDAYKDLCKEVDAGLSKAAIKGLVVLLNDLGIMLNIPEHRRLEETQVLNPGWLTNGVYQIVTSPCLQREQGRITFKQVKGILREEKNEGAYQSNKACNIVLDLMEHFKLCYEFPPPETGTYLIPSALPKDLPEDFTWKPASPLRFEYHYKTLPAAIIANFIVRVLAHRRSEKDYWRNGIIIQDERNQALIRSYPEDNRIVVEVEGAGNKRATLRFVRGTFLCIHEGFSEGDLGLEEKIPFSKNGKTKRFDYQEILNIEEMGCSVIPDGTLKCQVSVREILDGIEPIIDSTELEELIQLLDDLPLTGTFQERGMLLTGLSIDLGRTDHDTKSIDLRKIVERVHKVDGTRGLTTLIRNACKQVRGMGLEESLREWSARLR